ncbi:MAG: hypothetical protein LBC99_05975 [Spirochaetota bacterium]|jgi:hypothetical protein|nr:hypothetical protein [Spirochaetota bacterium]
MEGLFEALKFFSFRAIMEWMISSSSQFAALHFSCPFERESRPRMVCDGGFFALPGKIESGCISPFSGVVYQSGVFVFTGAQAGYPTRSLWQPKQREV